MEIDKNISRWILEFVLFQPINNTILNDIVRILSLPNNDSNLKKSLILRKIESEILNGSVTEKILELLELYEQLDYEQGNEASEELKVAYCAVAVECTVKFLKSDKGRYFETVKRVWKKRVSEMEKFGDVGFVCDELLGWRDEIEAALWDDGVCERVSRRSEGVVAVEKVELFVREAKERIGPSFLEVFAESYCSDDNLRALFGIGPCGNNGKEVLKGNTLPKQHHVACRQTRGAFARKRGRVRISDSIESEHEASGGQHDLSPIPEIEKAKEAVKLSSLEVPATLSSTARDNLVHQPVENNTDRAPNLADVPAPNLADVPSSTVQANGENCDAQHRNDVSEPNIMNQNTAGHTSESADPVEDTSEGSPNDARRFTLPSPKMTKVSPLKKYEFKNIKQGKRKFWSPLEEDTLRAGVQKYGFGSWTRILQAYPDIFKDRTTVNLKDKWRNMTK